MSKRAGFVQIKVDGVLMDATGDFTLNYGVPKKTMMTGTDGRVLGHKEEAMVPSISGKIQDSSNLDIKKLLAAEGATVTARKANGKTFVLQDAVYAGESTEETANADIDFKMEGVRAEEV